MMVGIDGAQLMCIYRMSLLMSVVDMHLLSISKGTLESNPVRLGLGTLESDPHTQRVHLFGCLDIASLHRTM